MNVEIGREQMFFYFSKLPRKHSDRHVLLHVFLCMCAVSKRNATSLNRLKTKSKKYLREKEPYVVYQRDTWASTNISLFFHCRASYSNCSQSEPFSRMSCNAVLATISYKNIVECTAHNTAHPLWVVNVTFLLKIHFIVMFIFVMFTYVLADH